MLNFETSAESNSVVDFWTLKNENFVLHIDAWPSLKNPILLRSSCCFDVEYSVIHSGEVL